MLHRQENMVADNQHADHVQPNALIPLMPWRPDVRASASTFWNLRSFTVTALALLRLRLSFHRLLMATAGISYAFCLY